MAQLAGPVAVLGLALTGAAARELVSRQTLIAWLVVAAVALVLSIWMSSRAYVALTPSTLRYRQWWREREVPLSDILRPQYLSGFQGRRLHVPVRGQRAVELYVRQWGREPLEDVAVQLRLVAAHGTGRNEA